MPQKAKFHNVDQYYTGAQQNLSKKMIVPQVIKIGEEVVISDCKPEWTQPPTLQSTISINLSKEKRLGLKMLTSKLAETSTQDPTLLMLTKAMGAVLGVPSLNVRESLAVIMIYCLVQKKYHTI